MKVKRRFVLTVLASIVAVSLLFVSVLGWTPVPVKDDRMVFMPGTQPDPNHNYLDMNSCNCHEWNDPYSMVDNWKGSMMAQAGRDPIFIATLVVAEQDSIWLLGNPNGGDLCIRCHSPVGWLENRSDPTNMGALLQNNKDFEGVLCMFCHSMVDPVAANRQPDVPPDAGVGITMAQDTYNKDLTILQQITLFNGTPFFNSTTELPTYYGNGSFPNWREAGGASFFVDVSNFRRGPRYLDSAGDPMNPTHNFNYSRFHRSQEFCHACHDVSNPAVGRALGSLEMPEMQAAASYAHVERTYSEFYLSDYQKGIVPNIQGIEYAASCQDCHMRNITSEARNNAGMYDDFAFHDMTGGNTWLSTILASAVSGSPNYDQYNFDILSGTKYPAAYVDLNGIGGYGQALLDGADRARQNLLDAANLTLVAEDGNTLTFRVVNNGGHKLISGYPEGRRMFVNIQFFDDSWNMIGEVNPYEDLVITNIAGQDYYVSGGNLTKTHDELIYECEMSSNFTGENHTKHFLLADDRYKDNRIPPRGFNTSGMFERFVQPRWHGENAPDYFTTAEYAGGYDEVTVNKPLGTYNWNITLYYQTTSKEYMDFLRDEINGVATTLTSPTPSGEAQAYIVQTDPFFTELKDWGIAMWDLWLHNGGSAPVVMETLNGTSPAPPEYTITLNEGWNLISLPLVQADESIDQALSNITGKWDNIQVYNATAPVHWQTNNTNRPVQFNTVDSLDHKVGFWINITEPGGTGLTTQGFEPSNTQIPLYAGWNLVGYPSLNTTRTIADALAGTGYDAVEGYDGISPYRITPLADTYVMQPGEGYWVHVPADTVWTVTSSEPMIEAIQTRSPDPLPTGNCCDAPDHECTPEGTGSADSGQGDAESLQDEDKTKDNRIMAAPIIVIPAISFIAAVRLPKKRKE